MLTAFISFINEDDSMVQLAYVVLPFTIIMTVDVTVVVFNSTISEVAIITMPF